MKYLKLTILAFGVLLFVAADNDDAFNTYANYDIKLSLKYPKGWKTVDARQTSFIKHMG